MRMCREKLQHPTHCDAQTSNTRFPSPLPGLNGDAVEVPA